MTFHIQSSRWSNPRVLSFVLSFPEFNEEVEFDVLPAFDALGEHPGPGLSLSSSLLVLLSHFGAKAPIVCGFYPTGCPSKAGGRGEVLGLVPPGQAKE